MQATSCTISPPWAFKSGKQHQLPVDLPSCVSEGIQAFPVEYQQMKLDFCKRWPALLCMGGATANQHVAMNRMLEGSALVGKSAAK